MSKIKGITYAAVSSSTFGLAPCFTLLLLGNGYTPFEVLSYRWGIASLCMILWGLLFRYNFRLKLERMGSCFRIKCLSGSDFFKSGFCLSEHCQWGSFYYSFYVSSGCCACDDPFFPGKKIRSYFYCSWDVSCGSHFAFSGKY